MKDRATSHMLYKSRDIPRLRGVQTSARRFTRGAAEGKLSSGVYRVYTPSGRGISGLYHIVQSHSLY